MKAVLVLITIFVLSCGGRQQPKKGGEVAYDPELFEMCLVEVVSDHLPACERGTDMHGQVSWKFPLAETDELKEMRSMRNAPGKAVAAQYLAAQLIKRPGSYKCSGNQEACSRVRRQVHCEAEVARTELIRMKLEASKWVEAFGLTAEVVRIGPSHYRYEEVPEYLSRMKASLPSGVTESCLAQHTPISEDSSKNH